MILQSIYLVIKMAGPEGFEPSTLGLKGRCSTLLSYGPINHLKCSRKVSSDKHDIRSCRRVDLNSARILYPCFFVFALIFFILSGDELYTIPTTCSLFSITKYCIFNHRLYFLISSLIFS